MPPEAEKHLRHIKDTFCELVDKKYRRGYDHHKQLVWKADLVSELEGEILDLFVYFFTLKDKLK